MRALPLASILTAAILPLVTIACAVDDQDDDDLGDIGDGKADGSLIDVATYVNKPSTSTGKPGARNYTLKASADFEVSLEYTTTQPTKIIVTAPNGTKSETAQTVQPHLTVKATSTTSGTYKIRLENYGTSRVTGRLKARGAGGGVTPELIAAARANLDRIAKEIDYTHLDSYGLSGSLTDKFMTALSAEYEHQHPDQYAARVRALASMAFFALPDVLPPAGGNKTPFHGLDMTQFSTLMSIEDQIFSRLVQLNGNDTNGVRPFSVCETRFIIETYVRPKVTFPGFDAHKTAYTTYAASCPQKDKDEWYNFRGLGGLRPSWVESNLADRFLRRMAKNCQNPTSAWTTECAAWNADRFGYRQLRNKQLAARTMFYAADQESYLIDPDNALVLLEDRNGDNVGEFVRPGPITLTNGDKGTLQVTSTSEFAGTLKFLNATTNKLSTISPALLVAESAIDPKFSPALLSHADLGLTDVFSDGTNCKSASLDPAKCPLMRRFYSMIDRHENFYQTYSALTPTYYGVSSQPSPLVACSITLGASHQWDTAGTPAGGTAGFIFLMRIPFKDIITGNDKSVSTLMPGPKTTSIQSVYTSGAKLDFNSAWLDVASLSNNQYATEHEISAFGAVPASEIEGILVVRKPAAVP
jgi:hypothetical protein